VCMYLHAYVHIYMYVYYTHTYQYIYIHHKAVLVVGCALVDAYGDRDQFRIIP